MSHYDDEMVAVVETAIDYLLSDRGRAALAKAAKESKDLADKFRRMRDVPWEKLHAPFNI